MGNGKPHSDKAEKPETPKSAEDASGGVSPQDAKPKDVADAAKDLKSNDPQKREKAAQKLDEIAQTAKDDQARKDAKEALKDAGAKGDDGNKPTEKPSETGGPPTEPKAKPGGDKSGGGGKSAPMGDKSPMDNPEGGAGQGQRPAAR